MNKDFWRCLLWLILGEVPFSMYLIGERVQKRMGKDIQEHIEVRLWMAGVVAGWFGLSPDKF